MSEAMITRRGGVGVKLQEKTATPSLTQQVIQADGGFGGLSKVTLAPISPTKGAEMYTPGLSPQEIAAGQYLTGKQTIAAISPTKAAQTYTPGTANQVIQSGRWLSGDQTILGSPNLLAANIKNGVDIFGVVGSFQGISTSDAILKVVTSTGCIVTVTGTGYSNVHQQADGFPRSDNANVTEHFFSIPASAFGTITVKATNTYGDNTKTLTVDTAGKVYEVLCGGKNILLNPELGPQEGLDFRMYTGSKRYDADYKCYFFTHNNNGTLRFVTGPYDLGLYDNIVLKGVFTGYSSTDRYFRILLVDKDGATRHTINYHPYTSGNNMEVSIPVADKSKSPYTLDCLGDATNVSVFRLNEFYFE